MVSHRRTLAVALALLAGIRFAAAASSEDTVALEERLAAAQARLEEAAQEVAELSTQLADPHLDRLMLFSDGAPRPLIGVQLDPASGKAGAGVISVSPGGPAAEAGIEAGDVIVAVNGESMVGRANVAREATEQLRHLPPDQPVRIKVLRAGKPLEFTVTPRVFVTGAMAVAGPMPFTGPMAVTGPMPFKVPVPPPAPMPGVFVHDGIGGPAFERIRRGLVGLELVTLTPGLGEYFGTDKGVLVVRAPKNDALKLEEGDVILDIGGRAPTSGAHATRILASYQPGERVTLEVLRRKKTLRIDAVTPS